MAYYRFGVSNLPTILKCCVCGGLLTLLLHRLLYIQDASEENFENPQPPNPPTPHFIRDDEIWCRIGNVYRATVPFDRITLILHISAYYFSPSIAEQIENWNAPVSLAVVIDDVNQQYGCIHHEISEMLNRHNFTQLSVHFLYKKTGSGCHPPEAIASATVMKTRNCSERRQPDLNTIAKYPMNLARNTARMFASTKFIIMSDADLFYSQNFEPRMRQAAERELTKNPLRVLVFRIYEIDENVISLPRTKADLKELIAKGQAVTFHKYVYDSHAIEGEEQWFATKENFDNTTISIANIPYTRFDWEPRFVSLPSIPFHDENFPYRVGTNTVLSWEMCRAGYKFALVNDLYVFHRGMRKKGQSVAKQNFDVTIMNRKRFDHALHLFRERMRRDHPQTEGKCPEIP